LRKSPSVQIGLSNAVATRLPAYYGHGESGKGRKGRPDIKYARFDGTKGQELLSNQT